MDEMELLGRFGEVDPLSNEVLERAEVVLRSAMAEPQRPGQAPLGRRVAWSARRRALVGIAAAAALVLGTGGGLLASRSGPVRSGHGTRERIVLTAAEVHRITARSSAAAASSGTAAVTQTSSENGVAQDGYDTTVTFSGSNIDEKITSVPEPPGSAKPFTTDDRLVDGQFYMYTPGPGDVLEWLHDTNSADDTASMQFPDPRTLYRAISPEAQLTVEGTATMNGENVTELAAGDPGAIDSSALGSLTAGSTITSFELSVDANDVVQQISLSTAETNTGCKFGPLTEAQIKRLDGKKLPNGKVAVTIPFSRTKSLENAKNCGPMTTTSNITVVFSNLGVPQSVTAPPAFVNFSGKG